MHRDLVAILLAAGRGRRFGGDKLLYPLPDGRAIALAAAEVLLNTVPEVLAVVPSGGRLACLLDAAGCSLVSDPITEQGMGHSLALGVASTPNAAGWIIALGDMPWIAPESVAAVAQAMRPGLIVAPSYRGVRGHPVGFAAEWHDRLLALEGDRGARELIEDQTGSLVQIPVDDPAVIADVDTPADLLA